MSAEVQHIADDREALKWALGSVRAGVAERLRLLRLHRWVSAHAVGILWVVIFIVSSAFNLGIAVAARLGYERAASVLGYFLRGFRYERFQALAAAMPVGLYLLMSLVVIGFTTSLYLNLRYRAAAFNTFCCALGLSLAAWLYQLGIPEYAQAISSPHRLRIALCFVLTAGVLGALRFGGTSPHSHLRLPDEGRP